MEGFWGEERGVRRRKVARVGPAMELPIIRILGGGILIWRLWGMLGMLQLR